MNIAAIMESTSEAMRVQISQTTQRLLDPDCFCTTYRGEITVPRLGNISTYWLSNKKLEVIITKFREMRSCQIFDRNLYFQAHDQLIKLSDKTGLNPMNSYDEEMIAYNQANDEVRCQKRVLSNATS